MAYMNQHDESVGAGGINLVKSAVEEDVEDKERDPGSDEEELAGERSATGGRNTFKRNYRTTQFPWGEGNCPVKKINECYFCYSPDTNIFDLFRLEIIILFSLCCFPFCRATWGAIFSNKKLLKRILLFICLPCACFADLFTIVVWLFNAALSTALGLLLCCVCCYSPTFCVCYNWIANINGFFYGCFVTGWCIGCNLSFMPCDSKGCGYGRTRYLMNSRILPCCSPKESFVISYFQILKWLIIIIIILIIALIIGLAVAIIVLLIVLVVGSGGKGLDGCGDCGSCSGCSCTDCLELCDCCCTILEVCECTCFGVLCVNTLCCSICNYDEDEGYCYMIGPKDDYLHKYSSELKDLV